MTIQISPADFVDLLKRIGSLGLTPNTIGQIMQSLDNLTAAITANSTAVTALTVAVDSAVTHIGTPGGATDQQLDALTSVVTGLTATVAAQTQRLNDAVAAPPPANTPTA